MTRDLDLAEDLAQDALVSALESWPVHGIPDNPGAWLMTIAKRRAVDGFRRADTLRRKTEELGHGLSEEDGMPDLSTHVDFIEDDVLRLIFLSCHPRLTAESRAALTLRLVGGLTTAEIARGFLATETAMGQRISRAKKTLAEGGVDFELPVGAERTARLDDVMAVVYLVFNEGYTATAGDDWMRPELTNEAIRLARMLAELVPDEPEVHGLQALLELQASRAAARVDAEGRPVLLDDQDRSRWDVLLVRRGLAALARAERLAERGQARRSVLPAGGDRVQACRRSNPRGDRLACHRPALRRARRGRTRSGRGGQPGGRARTGLRPGCRSRDPRRPPRGRARRVAPPAQRPRRPAGTGGPPCRGSRVVPRGGVADLQRERGLVAAGPRRAVPSGGHGE